MRKYLITAVKLSMQHGEPNELVKVELTVGEDGQVLRLDEQF